MNIETYSFQDMPSISKWELYKYRYDVFVNILGWQLDTPENMEKDEFDHEYAVYVVSKNKQGDIAGCARLLPTTQPYLMSSIFPDLLSEIAPPCSPEIWELSRFTTIDLSKGRTPINPRTYSQASKNLLDASLSCARARGANRVISVSPIGIERLVRMMGYEIQRMGPVRRYDEHVIVAYNINL